MYDYLTEREALFTDEGQRKLLSVRDRVHRLLKQAGAVRMREAIAELSGSTWVAMACVDRLVELGEIREVTVPAALVFAQYRVFVAVREL